MSISKRLLLLMIVAVAALLAVAGVNLYQMRHVYAAANYGNENTVPSLMTLNRALDQFMVLRIRVYRHVLNTEEKAMAEIESSIEESRKGVAEALTDYAKLLSDDEDKRLLARNEQLFGGYQKELPAVLDLSRQNRNQEALKELSKLADIGQQLRVALDAHIKYNAELGKKAAGEAEATLHSATWIAAALSLLAIVAVATQGLLIRSGVISGLREANQLAAAIAAGDLTVRREAARPGKDEIGQLIQAMDKMRQDLAQTVGAIAGSSERLAGSAAQLSATAQQVSASTQAQSGATASSAAAVEELTVSIDHVGGASADAVHEAQEAGELATASGAQVQAATQQINRVAASVSSTAGQIRTLSEHVQQIGNITTVIRDVADQTNLLALNAAIEAARAGEQGRGFAVVADEVRKLAERTTASVHEISSVIQTIQGSVGVAVQGMEENCAQVGEVVASAESASLAMTRIATATERVRDAITSISEAMQEQRSASAEVSRNVEAIAQMSEENSAAVAAVADTANGVVDVSRRLNSEVARFRL